MRNTFVIGNNRLFPTLGHICQAFSTFTPNSKPFSRDIFPNKLYQVFFNYLLHFWVSIAENWGEISFGDGNLNTRLSEETSRAGRWLYGVNACAVGWLDRKALRVNAMRVRCRWNGWKWRVTTPSGRESMNEPEWKPRYRKICAFPTYCTSQKIWEQSQIFISKLHQYLLAQ